MYGFYRKPEFLRQFAEDEDERNDRLQKARLARQKREREDLAACRYKMPDDIWLPETN